MNQESTSLNKYISQTGVCSRREADKWIEAGRVKINGEPARKGNRVTTSDVVTVDNNPLKARPQYLYIALNKPPGITCTTDQKDPDNIVDFVNHKERLFHIGRLDKPSSGLIFMTNDGDIVNEILRVENNHEKEYIVTVDKNITPRFLKGMSNGVPILGQTTKKCKIEQRGTRIFSIILTQGLNRQIRRMCEYFGYRVDTLKRIRIMNIKLDGIAQGEWRELTKKEITILKEGLDYKK